MEKKKNEGGLREGNISLILDSYDDLFSDFDPRGYSEKALSDDFLVECKKASKDKEERLELRFLVPKQKRNYVDEARIKKRLKRHFHKHFHEKKKEIKSIKKEGIMWFFLGAVIMIIATFLYEQKSLFLKFLFTISQPAGWFTFWEGLGKIFIEARKKIPDYEFYEKMKNSQIRFLDY